jgi:hypothetical protein
LPFPSVLDMMAHDPAWTEKLGNAVLTQRPEVIDAVQRMRGKARDYGYLGPNGYVNVLTDGGYIQILPINAGVIYVPYYDPYIVFAPPRPGFVVATAIHFGPAVTIGAALGTWGWWFGSGFLWPSHAIFIDHRPRERVWVGQGEPVPSMMWPLVMTMSKDCPGDGSGHKAPHSAMPSAMQAVNSLISFISIRKRDSANSLCEQQANTQERPCASSRRGTRPGMKQKSCRLVYEKKLESTSEAPRDFRATIPFRNRNWQDCNPFLRDLLDRRCGQRLRPTAPCDRQPA